MRPRSSLFTLTKRCLLFVCGLAKQNNRKPANSPIRPHRGSMHRANSQCVIGVRDLIQTGSLDTSMAASLPNSERTPFRTGVKVWFFLLALALPSAAQWRTGYYLQREAGGQTAATIPWSKYTHVIHYALRPTYSVRDLIQTGSLDTSMAASLPNSERTPFRTGVKVWFFLLALALPSAAQWRTGYYLQREAGGQ